MSNHKNKTAWNDVTGDSIRTGKGGQSAYENGWDIIWGKKELVYPTCIKCPLDKNKHCDYCGLRQADGDIAGWAFKRESK